MKKSIFTTFGIGAVAFVTLSACGSKNNDKGDSSDSGDLASAQVLRLTVPQELPTADLSLATDTISLTALNNVYEGIYRVGKDQTPEPAGASEEAKVSDDGKTYTIKLREDAKWSNGDPVTAGDYVFAWQRAVDPKTASEYNYLFSQVENAQDIMDGKADKSTLGVKAVDDYTLEVQLTDAVPYMNYLLAFPTFFPQNEKVAKEQGENYTKKSANAVYNGPFTLEGFDGAGDAEWEYKKNDAYWDAANVKLTSITNNVVKDVSTGLNMFQADEADDVLVSGEQAKQMQTDPAFIAEKEARTTYLEFNEAKGPNKEYWKNVNLRKAISFALDRKGLVENVLGDGSVVSTSIVPQDMCFDPSTQEDFVKAVGNQVEFDAAKAKEYWEKAKKELGISKLDITLMTDDDESKKKVAEKVQADILEQLDGIKVELQPVPFSVRLDRQTSGDFDMLAAGWGADYLDISSFTDLCTTDSPYNHGKWSNAEYDKLIKQAATTDATNPEKRWDDFKKATDILVKDEMGIVPVFQRAEGHLINTKAKDIIHHSAGVVWDYKWAYMTK